MKQRAIRVGILMCDHVDPRFADAAGGRDYDEMFADLLASAETGGADDPTFEVVVYDAVAGELPDSPDECDGWIITGSRHDAYRDDAWITALKSTIGEIASSRSRLVGVCFGHQIVAEALGGRVGPTSSWKIGPQPLDVDATPWFDAAAVTIHAMHRDVVLELPPGATPIGRGPTAEHPAYLVGDRVLCLQDHPELTGAYVAALAEARRDRLGADIVDDAIDRIERIPVDNPTVAGWIAAFLADRRRDVAERA